MSKNLVHHGYLNEEDIEKVLEHAGEKWRKEFKMPKEQKDRIKKNVMKRINEED